jgi:hypothetical protein
MRTVLWCLGAVFVAAVLFAPITGGGYCADAPVAGDSYCVSWTRSIVGIDSTLWLWLGATVILTGAAWWLSRRSRTTDRQLP